MVVIVCELRSVGVLLSIRVVDHLIHGTSHGDLVGQVSSKTSIEVDRAGLQVSSESSILHRKIIIFLFVHFFVDNILLGDSQGTSGSPFVNLRCTSS
jgi:hypothetical protein